MNCWHCDRPGVGVCKFCGRCVCKDHAKTMNYICAAYVDKDGQSKAIVVRDALFCGECRPEPSPIELEEL